MKKIFGVMYAPVSMQLPSTPATPAQLDSVLALLEGKPGSADAIGDIGNGRVVCGQQHRPTAVHAVAQHEEEDGEQDLLLT